MSEEQGFLHDLAEVHASLQLHTQMLSPTFLSDLANLVSTLPIAPSVDFTFLADRFDAWRNWARDLMLLNVKDLSPEDPLHCPISLFRTMGYGRLETAHTY
jgi:hypothetical protein